MRNFYYSFEFIFLRLSSELDEYCSKYEDFKKIKSKPAELVKKASEIFSESDEKEEIFEYAKVAYLEWSNVILNLASNEGWYRRHDDFKGVKSTLDPGITVLFLNYITNIVIMISKLKNTIQKIFLRWLLIFEWYLEVFFLYDTNYDFWKDTYQFKWRDCARGVCRNFSLIEGDFFTLREFREKFW